MSSNETNTSGGDIVATAGTYYRVTRYIITAVMLAMGLWFGYDGFINWPRQNREIAELEGQRTAATAAGDNEKAAKLLEDINKVGKHHSESDLRLHAAAAGNRRDRPVDVHFPGVVPSDSEERAACPGAPTGSARFDHRAGQASVGPQGDRTHQL